MGKLKDWLDSKKSYTRNEFKKLHPNAELKGACDDVLLYNDGNYIQVLFDGTFYECNTNRSKHLEFVEMELYLKKVEQKIYK
jgi:hypothetical protein